MEQNNDSRVAQMRQWIEQLNAASAAYYNGKEELMTDDFWLNPVGSGPCKFVSELAGSSLIKYLTLR